MVQLVDKISEIRNGKRVIVKKPELLAPAGNLEKLKIAVMYGADAVFIGGQEYSLRSNADNFTLEEIKEGVSFAKKYNAKVYVTTNIIAHNENIPGLENYLRGLEDAGVSGIIVADPLIIETAKKVAPGLERHLSTQQSLSNWRAAQYWKEEGLERVVLARETTAAEIKEIKEKVDIEVEIFVHGALCIAYSGRCVLSNHMTARDSNRGGCCQSCRWNYDLYRQEAGQEIPLFSDNDSPFAMSSKDLNLLKYVPQLIEMGIDSFKIEGRMKSIHYVATVVSVYRKVIDAYCADPDHFEFKDEWLQELAKCANRDTDYGFYKGLPGYQQQLFNESRQKPSHDFAGMVLDYDEETKMVTVQQRNFFKIGDQVEFFGPNIDNFTMTVKNLYDEEGNMLDAARHPLQIVRFQVDQPVHRYNLMRKENVHAV